MKKFKNLNEEIDHLLTLLEPEPAYIDEGIMREITMYLFYNKKKGTGRCSCCGRTVRLDAVLEATKEWCQRQELIPNSEIWHKDWPYICPECGRALEARSAGRGRQNLENNFRISYWMKRGKTLYLITKLVDVDFEDDIPRIHKRFRAIYIFGKNKPRKLFKAYDWLAGSKWVEKERFSYFRESAGMYYQAPKYEAELYFNKPLQDLLPGSYLKYAVDPHGWCLHMRDHVRENSWSAYSLAQIDCEYLGLFAQMPAVEVLHKTGFDYLIEERIRGSSPLSALNWKAVKLQKIFRGLNMKEIREIRDNEFSLSIIKEYQSAKKIGMNISVTAVARTINYRTASLDKFIERVKDNNPERCLKYLDENAVNAIEYLDYIRQCEELQLDLDDKKIRYPRIFIIAHATASEAVAELRAKQEEERNREKIEQFKERIEAAFPDGYEWHGDGLIIRPALLPSELRQEGNAMHHCVARYDDHVIRGDSFIIFIRQETEPDKSFVTMEVSQDFKRMYQIRAKANRDPAPEVRATAEEWLKEYKKNQKKLLKENRKETA